MKWMTRPNRIKTTKKPMPAREISRSIPDENAHVKPYPSPMNAPLNYDDREERERLFEYEAHVSEAGAVDSRRRHAR
jgi:hypothetical protein